MDTLPKVRMLIFLSEFPPRLLPMTAAAMCFAVCADQHEEIMMNYLLNQYYAEGGWFMVYVTELAETFRYFRHTSSSIDLSCSNTGMQTCRNSLCLVPAYKLQTSGTVWYQLDCCTFGLLDWWTAGLVDCRTEGLVDWWTSELVDCRTGGLVDCRTGGLQVW